MWNGYTLWWWDRPGTSRVHSRKGNACYPFCSDAEDVGVMKSVSQFPGTVHEEDLHEDQGHCCTRGRVTPTRKHTAREIRLHRISRAVHDAHEMSAKAANNSLHNYLAYQWFALSGSKRGSTPVPGKCYDDTWLKFLNAVLTQSSVSTAGHCRFLGG